jgi:hypothetical protein
VADEEGKEGVDMNWWWGMGSRILRRQVATDEDLMRPKVRIQRNEVGWCRENKIGGQSALGPWIWMESNLDWSRSLVVASVNLRCRRPLYPGERAAGLRRRNGIGYRDGGVCPSSGECPAFLRSCRA